jgi:hypothetical protein
MNTYTERGGAWVGRSFWWCLSGTWPFGGIRVSREAIEVSVGLWPLVRRAVIPAAEMRALRRRRGLPFRGLQVVPDRPDLPVFVVYWPLRPRRLWAALRQFGYTAP